MDGVAIVAVVALALILQKYQHHNKQRRHLSFTLTS